MRVSADWASTVSPFTQARAMECVGTGDGNQSGDGRIHSFEANRASGKFVDHRSIRCRETGDGGGSGVLGVDRYG